MKKRLHNLKHRHPETQILGDEKREALLKEEDSDIRDDSEEKAPFRVNITKVLFRWRNNTSSSMEV